MKKYAIAFISILMMGHLFSLVAFSLDDVSSFYSSVNTMKGEFQQKICQSETGTCILFKGKFFFKKPDLMRLEITSPYKQIVVSDGKEMTVYNVDEKVAVKTDAQFSAYAFGIFDLVKNYKNYYRVDTTTKEGNLTVYLLSPVDEMLKKKVDSLKIKVDRNKHIKFIGLYDSQGNESELELKGVKYNIGMKKSVFKLDLPKDVNIIDQRKR